MDPRIIIRKAREAKGLTQTQLADKLGLGLRMYQKIEDGQFPKYKTEQIRQIEAILGINVYELIYEQSASPSLVSEPLELPYMEKRRQLKTTDFPPIPVFAGNTQAGIITVYSDDPTMQKPVGHLPAELFPGCNHAEKVTGDSMYPLIINQGWVIGKVIDKKGIIWGEKYSIHTTYGLAVVKYVHPGTTKDTIKLVSHNKNVPPQEIPLDEVTFCCRIYHIINPA